MVLHHIFLFFSVYRKKFKSYPINSLNSKAIYLLLSSLREVNAATQHTMHHLKSLNFLHTRFLIDDCTINDTNILLYSTCTCQYDYFLVYQSPEIGNRITHISLVTKTGRFFQPKNIFTENMKN